MSKGLEALDKLMESFYELCEECNCNEDMYQMHNLTSPHHIVRKELERLEKLEKVVDILSFVEIFDIEHDEIRYYVDGGFEPGEITKEQYDLLKEMFGDEN